MILSPVPSGQHSISAVDEQMIAQDFVLDSALSLNQKMPYGRLSLVYESNYV